MGNTNLAQGSAGNFLADGARVSPSKIGVFDGTDKKKQAPTFHQFKFEKGEAKVFKAGWSVVEKGYRQVVAEPAMHGDNADIAEAIAKTRNTKGSKSKAKKRVDSLAGRPDEACIVIVGGQDVPQALLVHVDAPVNGVKKASLVNVYDLQTGKDVNKETYYGVSALRTAVDSGYFMQFDSGKDTSNINLLVVNAKKQETKQTMVSAAYKTAMRKSSGKTR